MLGQAGLELGDLAVQLGDDAYRGACGGAERRGDRGRSGQLLGPQRGPDLAGTGGDIAFPPTTFESGLDRRQVQVSTLLGGGCAIEHPQRIAVGQVLERLQRGRVVLTQCRAQRVGVPRACPDQALMSPGQYLDRVRLEAVAGDRAMVVPVGAHQIGQQFGIGGIGFGARDVMAVAIVGHRHRIDREHLIASGAQRPHP